MENRQLEQFVMKLLLASAVFVSYECLNNDESKQTSLSTVSSAANR